MASVDSGVETGNDSNDSSIVQHETQHATTVASPVAPTANVVAATTGQIAVDEVASVAITDKCESNESFLPTPSYLMTLRPHWPTDMTLCSVSMDHYKFNDLREVALTARDIEPEWQKDLIFKPSDNKHLIYPPLDLMKRNMPLGKYYERTYRRRITELRLRAPKECSRLALEEYNREYNSAGERIAFRGEWTAWRKLFNERKMRLAAATNDIDTLKELLRNNVSPNNRDLEGRTPLHHAACRGYTEVVRLLLERGADPNQRDRIGNTPLHLAAVTSKISVVTLLLAAGTDVRSIDQHGFNPLHLAQAKLKMLQNYKYESTVNVKEEMHGIVKMLMTYLNKQKNMNEQIETLNNFCSRLSLSNTSDQVQDDVKDLLANIETLDITS